VLGREYTGLPGDPQVSSEAQTRSKQASLEVLRHGAYDTPPVPKTPRRPQWRARLDRYHQFVVERLETAWGADRSEVIERMVVQWVIDHSPIIEQAGASLTEWREVQETTGGKPGS
jgi:hypothetical protein